MASQGQVQWAVLGVTPKAQDEQSDRRAQRGPILVMFTSISPNKNNSLLSAIRIFSVAT